MTSIKPLVASSAAIFLLVVLFRPLAGAPILEERRWEAEVDGKEATVQVFERWVVADRQAERQLGTLVFSENRFRDLKDVSVTVLDTAGRVLVEQSKRHLEKHCGLGASFQAYSDICYYTFSSIGQPFPYVIESMEKIELESLFFLRGTRLVPVDYPFGVSSVTLRLKRPSQVRPRLHGVIVEPRIVAEGDWTTYEWAVAGEDLIMLGDTEEAGYLDMIVQPLEFGGYEIDNVSWDQIGRWYAELARERYNLDEDPPATVADPAAVLDEIAGATETVREQCRYVSISLGVGGWRPSSAKATLSRGYGDCKDLTTALIELLRIRGVRALPVLVLTRDNGRIHSDYPEFGFNHVIAAVPQKTDTVWIDPTCEVCPPDDLPLMDEDLLSLLITENGGHLVRTPSSLPDDNHRELTANVRLNADFTFNVTGICSIRGNEAHRLKYQFTGETEETQQKLVERLFENSASKLEIESYEVSGLESTTAPFEIAFEVRSLKPLRNIRGKSYLTSDFLSVGAAAPCLLSYPNCAIDSFVINVAEIVGADSIELPMPVDTVIYSDSIQIAAQRDGDIISLVKREIYTGYLDGRQKGWDRADPPRDLRKKRSYVVTFF